MPGYTWNTWRHVTSVPMFSEEHCSYPVRFWLCAMSLCLEWLLVTVAVVWYHTHTIQGDQYCTVLYCNVLCCTVLYSTVPTRSPLGLRHGQLPRLQGGPHLLRQLPRPRLLLATSCHAPN